MVINHRKSGRRVRLPQPSPVPDWNPRDDVRRGYINRDLAADTIQELKVRFTNHGMAPMIIRFTVGRFSCFRDMMARGLCQCRSATRRSRAKAYTEFFPGAPARAMVCFGADIPGV